jgi:hypothetical protein
MNPICYCCGEEMIDKEYYLAHQSLFTARPKFKHNEHIIQNALYGRLKPNNILCQDCGTSFSQEVDTGFVNLFAPITERIKEILIAKDHGKDSITTLKGVLYKDNADKIEVQIRSNEANPIIPFYEYDEKQKIVTLYSNKVRAKQYKPIVEKELIEKGVDISELTFEICTDISHKGTLGVNFTEGVEGFNDKFKLGFCKIAVGFATFCGIERNQMPRVLKIDENGKGEIVFTNNLIPFVAIGAVDYFIELNRPKIEEYYPSHTIILFTQSFSETKKHLYCYIDLFSTFQYYLLLDDDFKGGDLVESYHQATTRQEMPEIDVRKIRPKYLNIVIDAFGIDKSKYKGESINDFIDFVEREVKKYNFNPRLDLKTELKEILSKIMTGYLMRKTENNPIEIELSEQQVPSFLFEIKNYFREEDEFNEKFFRRAFFEDDENGDVVMMSSPKECISPSIKHSFRQAYCHLKFDQMSKFIDDSKNNKKN